MSDPYLERAAPSYGITAWLLLESVFCDCDDVCTCGWDDIEEDDETPAL